MPNEPHRKIKVLYGTLEYKKHVGGVGAVTVGLTPALVKNGFEISVVTPFFDAYLALYKDKTIEKIATIPHIYKGKVFKSDIFRVVTETVAGQPIYHYLIKPEPGSSVAWLFNIERDEKNIYRSFAWSETHNRREYFNSAVAMMLREFEFDIYHSHTWHTGLAGVLAKEMEHLPKWQPLIAQRNRPLQKIPYMISTIHMLLAAEHGQLTTKQAVAAFLHSIGLPEDFATKFSQWNHYINSGHLKQVVLVLLYSDHITTVSEGLAIEAAHTKGGGQGLDDLFNWLDRKQRFEGILNGINHNRFDATLSSNLGEFAFDPHAISAGKYKLKVHLAKQYPQLDPNKMWFGFIGRFAAEKGMDMLLPALDAITQENGIFIVMGRHVVTPHIVNGKPVQAYQNLIDELRKHPNVLVIDDPEEQQRIGAYIRAATDCTTLLSHNEACGLPQLEGFANGSFAIAPNIQGPPDSVISIDACPGVGTGFLYNDAKETRYINVKLAIAKAAKFYREQHAAGTMDQFLYRIWQNSKQYDWEQNPAIKYKALYYKVLARPLLRYDQIRQVAKPMLHLLAAYQQAYKNNHDRRKMKNQYYAAKYAQHIPAASGKIFQIGFNKCGSQSVYFGFSENNVKSKHYGLPNKTLASIIFDNYIHGRKLLTGLENFDAFFDMEDIYHPEMPLFISQLFFKELDQQYPGSRFILLTRTKENWLKSRFSHKDPINGKSYAEVVCERYNCNVDELYKRWSKEWDDHHAEVRAYFAHRPHDYMEYNIETDSPQKICDFFADLNLDASKFKHFNKTMTTPTMAY